MSHTQRKFVFISVAVLTILARTTHGQSYYLAFSQSQGNIFSDRNSIESNADNHTDPDLKVFLDDSSEESSEYAQPEDNNFYNNPYINNNTTSRRSNNTNSTLYVIKKIRHHQADLSQTTMDVITIVWYVATFLALAAFFLLMACSDRRCNDARNNGATNNPNGNNNGNETPLPPPTPSPSYSEFAPPSYDTVMKMNHDTEKLSIFVIPFPVEDVISTQHNKDTTNVSAINQAPTQPQTQPQTPPQPQAAQPETPQTPLMNFYTISELHKFGS